MNPGPEETEVDQLLDYLTDPARTPKEYADRLAQVERDSPAVFAEVKHLLDCGNEHWPPRPGDDMDAAGAIPHGDVAPDGYEILGVLGRGGMGIVYEARQISLDRVVALKMIRDLHLASDDDIKRFRREAQAVAQLEHDHIVPIHEVGESHGRVFFSMKLIKGRGEGQLSVKGRTLADDLKAKKWPIAGREGECQAAILIAVAARAVHHAHQRQIVHRDLKPGNILLDEMGQPHLTDFGLAKHLAEGEPGFTQTGAIVGTAPYMAPEQARGEKMLTTAIDVYALGAILYELLTGRPPFEGHSTLEILDKVREQVAPSVETLRPLDRNLATICMKCLGKEPDTRYGSAEALAEDLEWWLASKPIKARRPTSLERFRLWRRRHPARAALITMAACFAIACAGAVWWYMRDRAEQERERDLRNTHEMHRKSLLREQIANALGQAEKPNKELEGVLHQSGGVFRLLNEPAQWVGYMHNAEASLRGAQEMLAGNKADAGQELVDRAARLDRSLRQAESDRGLAQKLEKIRLDRSMIVDGKFDFQGAAERYALTFAEFDAQMRTDAPRAAGARLAASPIHEQLLAALEDWAYVSFYLKDLQSAERLLAIARAAAPDPAWGDRMRSVCVWQDQQALLKLVEEKGVLQLSPTALQLVGNLLSDDNLAKIPWCRQSQAQYQSDFWLNMELGNALASRNVITASWEPGGFRHLEPASVGGQRSSAEAAAFYRVAVSLRPGSGAAHFNLANALHHQGKLAEAVDEYERAIALDPKLAQAHNNLGNTLHQQKKLPQALAEFQEAINCDPSHAAAHNNRGNVLLDQKRLSDAVVEFDKAIEKLPTFVNAHINRGNALRDLGKFKEAAEAYEDAKKFGPRNTFLYHNLGILLRKQDKLDEAMKAYQKAIEFDPNNARAHNNRGAILHSQGNLIQASEEFNMAVKADPGYAEAYDNLGQTLQARRKPWQAAEAYRKAIEIDSTKAGPYVNLGVALSDMNRLRDAIDANYKALAIEPKNANAYFNLGNSLRGQKKYSDAMEAYHKAIKLDPSFSNPIGGIGQILLLRGQFADAAKWLQEAADSAPPKDPLRAVCQNLLKQCRDLGALEKRIPLVLAGKETASPGELLRMANMCQEYQQRYGAAVILYQKAFKGDPDLAKSMAKQNRYNAACAAALFGSMVNKGAHHDVVDVDPPTSRKLARDWLQADLIEYGRLAKQGFTTQVQQIEERVSHWQTDTDLAGVRDPVPLAKFPDEEQVAWRALWRDARALLNQVRSRMTETKLQGNLTDMQTQHVVRVPMTPGNLYAIDLKSADFDSYLVLYDPVGTVLADNDNISGEDFNSRVVFSPSREGAYQLVATSSEHKGRGAYTLTIRAIAGLK